MGFLNNRDLISIKDNPRNLELKARDICSFALSTKGYSPEEINQFLKIDSVLANKDERLKPIHKEIETVQSIDEITDDLENEIQELCDEIISRTEDLILSNNNSLMYATYTQHLHNLRNQCKTIIHMDDNYDNNGQQVDNIHLEQSIFVTQDNATFIQILGLKKEFYDNLILLPLLINELTSIGNCGFNFSPKEENDFLINLVKLSQNTISLSDYTLDNLPKSLRNELEAVLGTAEEGLYLAIIIMLKTTMPRVLLSIEVIRHIRDKICPFVEKVVEKKSEIDRLKGQQGISDEFYQYIGVESKSISQIATETINIKSETLESGLESVLQLSNLIGAVTNQNAVDVIAELTSALPSLNRFADNLGFDTGFSYLRNLCNYYMGNDGYTINEKWYSNNQLFFYLNLYEQIKEVSEVQDYLDIIFTLKSKELNIDLSREDYERIEGQLSELTDGLDSLGDDYFARYDEDPLRKGLIDYKLFKLETDFEKYFSTTTLQGFNKLINGEEARETAIWSVEELNCIFSDESLTESLKIKVEDKLRLMLKGYQNQSLLFDLEKLMDSKDNEIRFNLSYLRIIHAKIKENILLSFKDYDLLTNLFAKLSDESKGVELKIFKQCSQNIWDVKEPANSYNTAAEENANNAANIYETINNVITSLKPYLIKSFDKIIINLHDEINKCEALLPHLSQDDLYDAYQNKLEHARNLVLFAEDFRKYITSPESSGLKNYLVKIANGTFTQSTIDSLTEKYATPGNVLFSPINLAGLLWNTVPDDNSLGKEFFFNLFDYYLEENHPDLNKIKANYGTLQRDSQRFIELQDDLDICFVKNEDIVDYATNLALSYIEPGMMEYAKSALIHITCGIADYALPGFVSVIAKQIVQSDTFQESVSDFIRSVNIYDPEYIKEGVYKLVNIEVNRVKNDSIVKYIENVNLGEEVHDGDIELYLSYFLKYFKLSRDVQKDSENLIIQHLFPGIEEHNLETIRLKFDEDKGFLQTLDFPIDGTPSDKLIKIVEGISRLDDTNQHNKKILEKMLVFYIDKVNLEQEFEQENSIALLQAISKNKLQNKLSETIRDKIVALKNSLIQSEIDKTQRKLNELNGIINNSLAYRKEMQDASSDIFGLNYLQWKIDNSTTEYKIYKAAMVAFDLLSWATAASSIIMVASGILTTGAMMALPVLPIIIASVSILSVAIRFVQEFWNYREKWNQSDWKDRCKIIGTCLINTLVKTIFTALVTSSLSKAAKRLFKTSESVSESTKLFSSRWPTNEQVESEITSLRVAKDKLEPLKLENINEDTDNLNGEVDQFVENLERLETSLYGVYNSVLESNLDKDARNYYEIPSGLKLGIEVTQYNEIAENIQNQIGRLRELKSIDLSSENEVLIAEDKVTIDINEVNLPLAEINSNDSLINSIVIVEEDVTDYYYELYKNEPDNQRQVFRSDAMKGHKYLNTDEPDLENLSSNDDNSQRVNGYGWLGRWVSFSLWNTPSSEPTVSSSKDKSPVQQGLKEQNFQNREKDNHSPENVGGKNSPN